MARTSWLGESTASAVATLETMESPDQYLTVLRLRHPDLAFHVDVTLIEHEGRWLATAMLADEPDIGTGDAPRETLRAALAALGERCASEMAASAELPA
jgi:hypothetical protein